VSTGPADQLREASTRLRALSGPAARNLADGHGDHAVDIAGDHALLVAESILNPTAPDAFQQQLTTPAAA
jgi:hypothetical protein